jgi:hypothetical protein
MEVESSIADIVPDGLDGSDLVGGGDSIGIGISLDVGLCSGVFVVSGLEVSFFESTQAIPLRIRMSITNAKHTFLIIFCVTP